MQAVKNTKLRGSEDKPMLVDFFPAPHEKAPLVVYAHGFNGFKDWGSFDLIAAQFAAAGFCFVKFNFSHNGTTPDEPEAFADPEAYGQNNYTKELDDLQTVIDWAMAPGNPFARQIDAENLFLLGHSRGGGIVLLKAGEDPRVKAVATWASVAECKTPWGNLPEERMSKWNESGVEHYVNSRTGQKLPLYYQLYQDYIKNHERLDILKTVQGLKIPLLFCHGTADDAVPAEKARLLKTAAQNATLFLLDTDHVFGRKHPWPHDHLPAAMQTVVDQTIAFFAAAVRR